MGEGKVKDGRREDEGSERMKFTGCLDEEVKVKVKEKKRQVKER